MSFRSLSVPKTAEPVHARRALGLAALWEMGALWMVWLIAGALWLAASLAMLEREQSDTLRQQGIALTLIEIQEALEGDLALGFDLASHQHAQALLDAALARNHELHSLDIAGIDGRTLFSTDRGAVGEPLPEAVAAAARGSVGSHRIWQASVASEPVLGLGLRGPFGEPVGHVTSAFRPASLDVSLQSWGVVAVALGFFVLAGGLLLVQVAKRTARQPMQERSGAMQVALGTALATRGRFEGALAHTDESEALD